MTHNSATLQKPDILLVDDTPDNIRFLSSVLLEQGYSVRKAISGKMALTAAKTVKPDLILLDVNMPEMNGYEVCEFLKKDEETRTIPIIFLSALDDVLDKVKAFQVGGVDYITKPFHLEEILVRIQNQLTIQNLQNTLQIQNTQLQDALTELKTTQAQLIHKEKMLSLSRLVAGIAHEINNPISFIAGNLTPARQYIQELVKLLALYQQEYPQPSLSIQEAIQEVDLNFIVVDLEKLITSMQTGVERVHTIILALRIFSRLGESDIKAVNLHEGIDSALVLLQPQLRQEGSRPEIQVIKNYGNLPLITCYASQINQVFLNIIDNAIDALELGTGKDFPESSPPTIWISTELIGERVIIKIKDNGAGISEDVKLQLFDPFFTTKPVGKGSGLGLSTSYQIVVEKHKGQLTCFSSPGKGAEFVVEIPVYLSKK